MAKKTYLEDPELYKRYSVNIGQAAKWDRLVNSEEFKNSGVRSEQDFYQWAPQHGITDPKDYWESAQENYNLYYQIYQGSDIEEQNNYPEETHRRRQQGHWGAHMFSGKHDIEGERKNNLLQGAKAWEDFLEVAADLEKKDTSYRGPKFAEAKSIIEAAQWLSHFGSKVEGDGKPTISIDIWLRRRYHKANNWQQVLNKNKKIGLAKTREEFLQLRKEDRKTRALPENFWETTAEDRAAHYEWRKTLEWDDWSTKHSDQNLELKEKDETAWRSNLLNLGIESIRTEEEWNAWVKAKNATIRKEKDKIPENLWREVKPYFDKWTRTAQEEIAQQIIQDVATEAQPTERTQISTPPPERPGIEQAGDVYTPPEGTAAFNNRSSGETSSGAISAEAVSQLVNDMSEEERAQATAAEVNERNPQPFPQVSMDEPDVEDANAQQMQNQQAIATLQRQEEEQQQEQQGSGRPSRPSLRQARKVLSRFGGAGRATASGGFLATFAGTSGGAIFLVVLGVVLVVVLIIIFFIILLSGHGDDKILLHIEKKGPDAVEVTQNMEYQIATSYNDKDDVLITDLIPDNAEFVTAGGIYEKLDASGKPTTDNAAVKKVTWTVKGTGTLQAENKFDEEKFKQMGFPSPSSPVSPLTQVEQENWYKNSLEWAKKAAQLQGIDIGILGAIARIQTNNNSHPLSPFIEMCNNKEQDVNKPCENASWQVGYGVKPAEVSVNRLQEAIDKMYAGGSVNIASLGNEIIQRSKTRDGGAYELKNITFPGDITLETLFTGANQGNADQRKMWGILMKDDAISIYLLASAIKDVTSRQGKTVAENLEAVNSTDFKKQNVIDSVKAIYDDGFKPVLNNPQGAKDFTITLKPKVDNSYVINKANIVITNAGSSGGSSIINITSSSLVQILADAANRAAIPEALLKALMKRETSGVPFQYTEEEVKTFTTRDWWVNLRNNQPSLKDNDPLIIRGFAYNTCMYFRNESGNLACPSNDVRGAMQFEIGTWAGVKAKLQFEDNHDPARENLRDVTFGAAQLIRNMVTDYQDRYANVTGLDSWTGKNVMSVARTYCGGNPSPNSVDDGACGGVIVDDKTGYIDDSYDVAVCNFYYEYKNMPPGNNCLRRPGEE